MYDWFEYTGRDAAFEQPLPPGHYRNPILSGFHGSEHHARRRALLSGHSTFAYFPGIPVFESRDLVHWRQIGSVIDRPSQLDFSKLGVSRGVFAPSIEYRDGLFYVFNTHVDGGGNYVVTAKNPADPWSDPTWLPELEGGIDPSMFVDDDGRCVRAEQRSAGRHAALQRPSRDLDPGVRPRALKLKGPRKVLVDGGVDPSKNPIWIEGPHIYKRAGWYYLSCAEGGTGQHSQVVLRSRSPWGPFEAYAGNPILTQRDLPADRQRPVTNAGHADLVEAPDGSWWATFLATRTYEGVHYNTGRETFLLPVTWRDGWPIILEQVARFPMSCAGRNSWRRVTKRRCRATSRGAMSSTERRSTRRGCSCAAGSGSTCDAFRGALSIDPQVTGSMTSRLLHSWPPSAAPGLRRDHAVARAIECGHRSGPRGISERDALVLPRYAPRWHGRRDLCREEERRAAGQDLPQLRCRPRHSSSSGSAAMPRVFVPPCDAGRRLAGPQGERRRLDPRHGCRRRVRRSVVGRMRARSPPIAI